MNQKARAQKNRLKAAVSAVAVLALMLPSGLALADNPISTTTDQTVVSVLNTESASGFAVATDSREGAPVGSFSSKPDPSKVKFTLEQAMAKLKELFPDLQKASVTQSELGVSNQYPPPVNQQVWNINWTYQSGNISYGFSSEVDAITGDLINVYFPTPIGGKEVYYPPKLTEQEALNVAKAFIPKAVGSVSADVLELTGQNQGSASGSLFGPVQYSFSFQLNKNGIPNGFTLLTVTVDADGSVIGFTKPADPVSYPSPVPTVTQSEADRSFTEEFATELNYVPIYRNGTITSYILAWVPSGNVLDPIDAQTGKRIDFGGQERSAAPAVYSAIPATTPVFSPNGKGQKLTAEEAEALVKAIAVIPDGRELQSSLTQDYRDPKRQMWVLTWQDPAKPAVSIPEQSYAEVDAGTGQIMNFSLERFEGTGQGTALSAPGTAKLTEDQLKQKAIQLVNLLNPDASHNLKIVNPGISAASADGTQYNYSFIETYKDIPVQNATLSVSLDSYGRLVNYASSWVDPKELKDIPAAAVTSDKALSLYKDRFKAELSYSRFGGYYVNGGVSETKVLLVYAARVNGDADLNHYQILDAVTGKWTDNFVDVTGDPAQAPEPSDLAGNWAEKDLSVLLQYGVITPDSSGKVNPNQAITVRDWLEMMAKAVYPSYQGYGMGTGEAIAGVSPDGKDYPLMRFAAEEGWITRDEPLKLDAKLTRDELALRLAYILKYDKLSDLISQSKTISEFSDAAAIHNKGAAALAVELGLLSAQGDKFGPTQEVTKAEAASVILRLVKLQGKTDQKIGLQ